MRSASLLAVALLSAGVAAHADTVTDLINVNASAADGQTVDMTFSLTFDPTQNTLAPTNSGLNLISITNSDPAFAATYQTPLAWDYYNVPNASLDITSTTNLDSNGQYAVLGGTNSFDVDFFNVASGVPSLASFDEANASSPYVVSLTGNLTVTPETTGVTPEPSSIALLGTGLLGIAGVVRRRFV